MKSRSVRTSHSKRSFLVLLAMGGLVLTAATGVAPGLLAHFSAKGGFSPQLVQKIQAVRLLLTVAGSLLVIGSCWRVFDRRLAVLGIAGCLGWSVALVSNAYPSNLLFQPLRVAKVVLGEELLLRDYEPRAYLTVPVHQVLRARYPVINIHTHFRRGGIKTPGELIAIMDQCNLQTLVDLDGELDQRFREERATYAIRHPDRFILFATFWFGGVVDTWDHWKLVVDELEDAKRMGAKGIKIWKNLGLRTRDEHGKLIPVDDMRLEPLWNKAAVLKLPILIHLGDPLAFFEAIDKYNERYEDLKANPEWSFYGPQYPSLKTILAQFERVVSRHPDVTFILAHLGNRTDDLAAAGAMLDRHSNLYMDFAARASELGRQPAAAREFFIRYQDRLLFGTDGNPGVEVYRSHFRFLETADDYFDYPYWPEDNFGRWKIYGLHLPDEILRKVYHDNAARLLGLPLLAEHPQKAAEVR